jgi:hemoglobin-like flavoprotein
VACRGFLYAQRRICKSASGGDDVGGVGEDIFGPDFMTNHQQDLLLETLALLEPKAEIAARLFCQRLFTTAPSLRFFFPSDLEMQGRKLLTGLKAIVSSLDDTEVLIKIVRPMGEQNRASGVKAWHYENAGEALLWTFQELLGARFNPEMLTAWRAAYRTISGAMIQGTRHEEFASATFME